VKARRLVLFLMVIALVVLALLIARPPQVRRVINKVRGRVSLREKLAEYGPAARKRLATAFEAKSVAYPPKRLVLVGLKRERVLQVYASSQGGDLRLVTSYPILGASGHLGPKLKEGDRQVPEGIYRVTYLNPNSLYHLSLRLDYPNAFDRQMAENDGRTDLGGDIMIHGDTCSIGCLAMGDPASEDLFVLAADTGIENIKVILSPVDFRTTKRVPGSSLLPKWTAKLYKEIAREIATLEDRP